MAAPSVMVAAPEVTVGRISPDRVELNVTSSALVAPRAVFPVTVKSVPMVRSAANFDVRDAYIPPVVLIDAYDPPESAATAETTLNAVSLVPV